MHKSNSAREAVGNRALATWHISCEPGVGGDQRHCRYGGYENVEHYWGSCRSVQVFVHHAQTDGTVFHAALKPMLFLIVGLGVWGYDRGGSQRKARTTHRSATDAKPPGE